MSGFVCNECQWHGEEPIRIGLTSFTGEEFNLVVCPNCRCVRSSLSEYNEKDLSVQSQHPRQIQVNNENDANGSALLQFIADTERAHFRTVHDSGANSNAMMLWNLLREHAGLSKLRLNDLPTWCSVCSQYHKSPMYKAPCKQQSEKDE